MKKILFVCVENSCRSQMAEGFAKKISSDKDIIVYSAGSKPSGKVNPNAIKYMKECGIDLSGHKSTGLDNLPEGQFDAVITMGCGDSCPDRPR